MQIDDDPNQEYTYDNLYQLTFVDYNDGSSTNFYYDTMGNRNKITNGGTIDYSSNCLNQYTCVDSVEYKYDENGNLTDDGTYLYYYDCENRLADVNDKATGEPVASYFYDFRGRRVKKVVYGEPDVTTKYCYDGERVIAEYDGSGTLLRGYVYGPGIDEVICMMDYANSKIWYYHYDGLGSVIATTDTLGDIVERYEYDVFGRPTILSPSGEPRAVSDVNNPYMFTGRRYDEATGLYYYRFRYYKPEIGRFLNPDPIGYDDSMNLYTYCGNNPLNFVDPMGLQGSILYVRQGGLRGWYSHSEKESEQGQTPEQLLGQLGIYGNPYNIEGARIGPTGAPPRYSEHQTVHPSAWGLGFGSLTPDHGFVGALSSGEAWLSSLRLDTYRRYGTNTVAYHQLYMYWDAPPSEQPLLGDPSYRWVLQKEPNFARCILLNNPQLMRDAIERTRASWFTRYIFEPFADAASNR